MDKKQRRANRIQNRSAMANGVAQANAVQQVQTDHLASAVQWAQKAEFGPALAWLTCGWHLTSYVRGALAADKGRTGGGGNLSAVRANAKKIATGRILEATGGSNLPDVDELIRSYSAYNLLSGHDEPLPSTCDAPWSGFRELQMLATRSQPESEGWTFEPVIDVAKAKQVYTDWLTSRPGGARITVASLTASIRELRGLAPKAPKKTEAPAPATANPATDSGEKPATIIVPGSTVAPNATVNPPAPPEGAEGSKPTENPAAPSVAAQEAQPSPTEGEAPNPNFVPGNVVSTTDQTIPGTATGEDFDDSEDVETGGTDVEEDTKSDLPKPRERKADVNAIAFDGKPENVAAQFLEVLLEYDDAKDGHRVMMTLGHLLAHESMEKNSLFSTLLEAYCEVSQDKETLEGIAEMAETAAASLAPTAAAVA